MTCRDVLEWRAEEQQRIRRQVLEEQKVRPSWHACEHALCWVRAHSLRHASRSTSVASRQKQLPKPRWQPRKRSVRCCATSKLTMRSSSGLGAAHMLGRTQFNPRPVLHPRQPPAQRSRPRHHLLCSSRTQVPERSTGWRKAPATPVARPLPTRQASARSCIPFCSNGQLFLWRSAG